MFDDGDNLKKIRLDIRVFKENRDIYDKKHNRNHRIYDNMSKSNVKRISKATMTNVISECDLNFMKMLFNALIRKTKKNVTLRGC